MKPNELRVEFPELQADAVHRATHTSVCLVCQTNGGEGKNTQSRSFNHVLDRFAELLLVEAQLPRRKRVEMVFGNYKFDRWQLQQALCAQWAGVEEE